MSNEQYIKHVNAEKQTDFLHFPPIDTSQLLTAPSHNQPRDSAEPKQEQFNTHPQGLRDVDDSESGSQVTVTAITPDGTENHNVPVSHEIQEQNQQKFQEQQNYNQEHADTSTQIAQENHHDAVKGPVKK